MASVYAVLGPDAGVTSTLAHRLAGHLLHRYGDGPGRAAGRRGNCARGPSTS